MVPQKIHPYISKTIENSGKYDLIVEGILDCCNQNDFILKVIGKAYGKLIPKLYPDGEIIKLVATCAECQKEIMIFDSECDGYDRQIKDNYCTGSENEGIQDKRYNKYCCPKCGSEFHSVTIKYDYPDASDLSTLDLKDPTNAYTWITVSLTCSKCGKKSRAFIDAETG